MATVHPNPQTANTVLQVIRAKLMITLLLAACAALAWYGSCSHTNTVVAIIAYLLVGKALSYAVLGRSSMWFVLVWAVHVLHAGLASFAPQFRGSNLRQMMRSEEFLPIPAATSGGTDSS